VEGGPARHPSIPFDHFGFFWEQLTRSEFLIVNRCDDIPSRAVLEREWYESNGFRSLLIIPMILDKKIYGLLSFYGPPHETKIWPEEFILLIRLIADRFMNLLNRKNVEIALLKSKKLTESLLNATTDSAMLISKSGSILAVNESFCRMLGKKRQDVLGANLFTLTPPELVSNRKKQVEKVIREKVRVSFEDETKDRCFHHVFYPVLNGTGTVEKLAYYSHDVSNVKHVEKSIRNLTKELIKAQESEKQRIANDLHDNVAQELASLRIHCDALFEQIPDMSPHARDVISGFSKTIKNSIETVRDLAYELQPPGFDHVGLVRSLYRYCEDFSQKHIIKVDFFSGGMNNLNLDFNTEITIHRIVREALANIRAHSGADKAVVRLVASHPTIMLRIEDNGRGFDPAGLKNLQNGNKASGLKSMEGRVRLQNGKMRILTKPGSGTRILVELPIPEGCLAPALSKPAQT
jgi:PAS domain S-box-containing protein